MAPGLDVARYASTNARVRGLWSQLLGRDAWDSLIAAETLSDALSLLRNTSYAAVIPDTEDGASTTAGIERRLSGRAAANCRRCMAFLRGPSRVLVAVWWQHYELENLKALFRGIHQGLSPSEISSFTVPLEDASSLPWSVLLQERSITSLIERLDGTHYINPLRNALPAFQRERSLFPLEVALDIRYYRDIAAAIKKLDSSERAEARRLLGTHIDILNVLWAFRYRVYYGLSAEEIVNYTMWHTFRTDVDLIQAIALGATPSDVIVRVWGRDAIDWALLDENTDEHLVVPKLEMVLMRYWRQLAVGASHGYPFRLGALLAYLILQELETQDLVRLLEGKAMGWPDDRITTHLIRIEG